MCGDNPVKEIGGGQWDSWNTYHTTGKHSLLFTDRQMHLSPQTLFARWRAAVLVKLCLRNPNAETLHIQSSKQDNETEPN